jgi:putative transcriptional regulator
MRSSLVIPLLFILLAGASTVAAAPPVIPHLKELDHPVTGCFLVAQRGQYGPYFARSVVYLVEHNAHGSIGLIINQPLGKRVADVLPDLQHAEAGTYPLWFGGPLSLHIMVLLFRGQYQTDLALPIRDGVYASSNLRMLDALVKARKPASELRMYAGQADWSPGQLEQEVADQSWYVVAGDPDVLFNADSGLWQQLINQLDPPGIVAQR